MGSGPGATVRRRESATRQRCEGATVRRCEGAIVRGCEGATVCRRAFVMLLLGLIAWPALAAAQTIERITFDEAIRRATTNNPTIQQAAAGILRAEALLQQVTSRTRPSLDASVGLDVIDPVTSFDGTNITPRAQSATSATFRAPIWTPLAWAQRVQAADQVIVAQSTVADVRRQLAVATADAYLAVIVQRRGLELNERARDAARAHFDFANQRFEGGLGSRLNMLRAQQELSSDEARVEDAQLAVRRAQEALGVLVVADGPVDASAEPVFDVPQDGSPLDLRTDIRLIAARQSAAERVLADSWKDRLPSLTALFTPVYTAPSGLFAPSRSLRGSVLFSVSLFDSGLRTAQRLERSALLDSVRAERAGLERQVSSEVRTAREAVRLTERAVERARAAASQSEEVLRITDIAFREGATTNIEVIDAQRRARDAATTTAIAEDALRRARLELLVATGRFPQ
jgi:outer membrane protein TolC